MPDIRTALQQALSKTANAWAADDEAHQQIQPQQEKTMTITTTPMTQPTPAVASTIETSVSRTVFNFIRDNPGKTVNQAVADLRAKGLKQNSVGSLIYQMLKVRLLVADDNGRLSAVVREYVPIQTSAQRKAKAKAAKAAAQPRKQVTLVNTRTGEVINPKPAGIAALPTTHLAPTTEWTVESVIGSLNVRQAMAVYDELRKIFGA